MCRNGLHMPNEAKSGHEYSGLQLICWHQFQIKLQSLLTIIYGNHIPMKRPEYGRDQALVNIKTKTHTKVQESMFQSSCFLMYLSELKTIKCYLKSWNELIWFSIIHLDAKKKNCQYQQFWFNNTWCWVVHCDNNWSIYSIVSRNHPSLWENDHIISTVWLRIW